jgi:transcriptional regulator with XRE-family HTH domain
VTREDLRRIRESLGLSRRALARRIGVAPRTIARWEAGVHPIGLVYERLIRIQAAAPGPGEPAE